MRLTALILCCLLIGCSHAASVMPSRPDTSATETLPHVIGGWTQYPLTIPIGFDLVTGHDGNLYGFGYSNGAWDELVKIDGQGNETPIKISGGMGCSAYETITPNPDGNVYAIETLDGNTGSQAVAQVTPQGGVIEFSLPYTDCSIGMVSGSDGNLWIMHDSGFGRMTTAGQYTEFGGVGSSGFGVETQDDRIVRGPDKNLWAEGRVNQNLTNVLIRISVTDGSQTTFALPNDAAGLVEGPGGTLFMMGTGQVYQVNMDGSVTSYPLNAARSGILMHLATRGRLFWTKHNAVVLYGTGSHKIERRVAMPLPAGQMTLGADHASLWFTGSDIEVLSL